MRDWHRVYWVPCPYTGIYQLNFVETTQVETEGRGTPQNPPGTINQSVIIFTLVFYFPVLLHKHILTFFFPRLTADYRSCYMHGYTVMCGYLGHFEGRITLIRSKKINS